MPPDWYDEEGYELNPGTGKRLTDEEIDADWEQWGAPDIEVEAFPCQRAGSPTRKPGRSRRLSPHVLWAGIGRPAFLEANY